MRSDIVYLKDVLGVEFVHTSNFHAPDIHKKPPLLNPKITLVALAHNINNEFNVQFEKLKSLLESYLVLGEVLINPDVSKLVAESEKLILCLGKPPNFVNQMSGTWYKAKLSRIMWTHPVSKFEDIKLKTVVWKDIKKAIRTCGVEI